jgi:glycosyltransferase involved in cell wall biosynthesis
MDASPGIAVVTATHNRAERLSALLAALRKQSLRPDEFEVVIVDDASSDATPALLEREQRRGAIRLRAVRNETARGPAAARNRGWQLADAPVIAFTDDDCIPTRGWLEALLSAGGNRCGLIVTGRTLPEPSERHLLGPFAKTVSIDAPSPHYETCNVAYPRSVLERVGGFDEDYPSPAGEDSDLGARALVAGAEAHFAPEALVHHAVFPRGPLGALRDALLATDGTRAYKRNPSLRAHLAGRIFYDRSHALLLQAAVGGLLARRNPHAAVLALPYLHNVRNRCAASGARPSQASFFLLFDVLQIAATLRGAARNRTLII